MYTIIRDVVLPDGTKAKEHEDLYGSSETQAVYRYEDLAGNPISTECFSLDYWFRIKGLKFGGHQ